MVAVVLIAVLSQRPSLAQGDGPRAHWKGMLTETSLVSITYMTASGNVNPFDPAHTVLPGGSFDADVALLGYSRSLGLFDRTAVATILLPVGNVQGEITGPVPGQDSARGFGDPMLQLDVNLIGTPAMRRMPELLRYEPDLTVDLLVTLAVPLGEYDDDSAVNLGQNRWYGRVGMPIMKSLGDWVPGSRTTLEFLPAVWLFGDNSDFLGQDLENDPLFQLDAHLTRDFTATSWASLDAVWYAGGEATIGGTSAEEINALGVGFTLGFEINQNMLLTAGYVATVGDDSNDMDLGSFRINLVNGWHPLIEGINRLRGGP